MIVMSTGDRLCFHVTQHDDDDAEPYLVDMQTDDGLVGCNCSDFKFRCHKKLLTDGHVVPYNSKERNVCKHVNAVIMFIGESGIAAVHNVEREQLFNREIF